MKLYICLALCVALTRAATPENENKKVAATDNAKTQAPKTDVKPKRDVSLLGGGGGGGGGGYHGPSYKYLPPGPSDSSSYDSFSSFDHHHSSAGIGGISLNSISSDHHHHHHPHDSSGFIGGSSGGDGYSHGPKVQTFVVKEVGHGDHGPSKFVPSFGGGFSGNFGGFKHSSGGPGHFGGSSHFSGGSGHFGGAPSHFGPSSGHFGGGHRQGTVYKIQTVSGGKHSHGFGHGGYSSFGGGIRGGSSFGHGVGSFKSSGSHGSFSHGGFGGSLSSGYSGPHSGSSLHSSSIGGGSGYHYQPSFHSSNDFSVPVSSSGSFEHSHGFSIGSSGNLGGPSSFSSGGDGSYSYEPPAPSFAHSHSPSNPSTTYGAPSVEAHYEVSSGSHGDETPSYAQGHKGLRHFGFVANNHNGLHTDAIGSSDFLSHSSGHGHSKAPFKPSTFLGSTHEGSNNGYHSLSTEYGPPPSSGGQPHSSQYLPPPTSAGYDYPPPSALYSAGPVHGGSGDSGFPLQEPESNFLPPLPSAPQTSYGTPANPSDNYLPPHH